MEKWKDIKGYEGLYQVSDEGRVKSVERIVNAGKRIFNFKSKLLKPIFIKNYYSVHLSKNNKTKMVRIHRLVAEAFISNPDKLPCVNHKDEKTTNNKVENLEWCSPKYNNNYGTHNKKISEAMINKPEYSKQVYQYTIDGILVKKWPSIREAERNGFQSINISRCCNGGYFYKAKNKWINITQHKGYKWSYKPL